MFKYGIVSEVKRGFAKVEFQDDNFVSDWLPVLVRKSKSDVESWQLEILEHVVCLMDEHCNEGVILGAICSDEDPGDPGEGAGKFRKKFSDGTVIEYDKTAHKLTVDVKGSLDAKTTGEASIDAQTNLKGNAGVKAVITAPNIELTGAVKITGAVTILGALSAGAISTVPGAGGGSGDIAITGNVNITGNMQATGNVEGGEVKVGLINLSTHKHTSGGSGSPTSTPIP